MPVALPTNPYCDAYDFRAVFDLARGKISFDISPTQFKDVSGFIGVSFEITTPAGVFSPQGYVISASDPAATYDGDIPMIKGVYRWGNYTIRSTIFLQGNVSASLTKERFISPPECLGDINHIIGTINLALDCNKGSIIGRGFSGYVYQGKVPVKEVWAITRYYPPEAELPPQKDITEMPFVIAAYEGVNKFKGINTSRYDLDDNVFVVVEIKATEEKNVRCLVDYDVLLCAVQNELKVLRSCNATAPEYNKNLSEINALLWMVTAGSVEGKDVGDEVTRLEQLLGVDCSCQACAGKRIGEDLQGLPVTTVPVPIVLNREFQEGEFQEDEFN